MPTPDADAPPRRRAALRPSPRALLLIALAVALGVGAFAMVWFNERDDYDFFRGSEGAPPTAAQPSYQPLPAPSAGRRDSGLSFPDEPEIAPTDAVAEEPGPVPAPGIDTPPPPPPPAATGESRPPRPIAGQTPSPTYPASELRRGRGGTVVLRVEVGADGRPTGVTVASSSRSRALDRAAMSAVRDWRFEPALVDGQPAAGTVRVPVEFTPQR